MTRIPLNTLKNALAYLPDHFYLTGATIKVCDKDGQIYGSFESMYGTFVKNDDYIQKFSILEEDVDSYTVTNGTLTCHCESYMQAEELCKILNSKEV